MNNPSNTDSELQVSDCLVYGDRSPAENIFEEIRDSPVKNALKETRDFKPAETLEKLNLLLNLSCQSAPLEPLTVAQKNGETRKERSQINLFVQAPFGTLKSTMFAFTAKSYTSITLTDVSFPKLVGSYDIESRKIVPSASWEYRKKTIILDEFHFKEGIINALLQLMEGGEYTRAVARNLSEPTNKRDHDLYFKCSRDG